MSDELHDIEHKILQLFDSDDETNVELAVQLCVGLQGNYSEWIAQKLQSHVFLCLQYGLEQAFFENLEVLDLADREMGHLPAEITQLKKLRKIDLGTGIK